MLKPFSVTYWIGETSFAKLSGITCLLFTAIATIKSATLFLADACQQLDDREVGVKKGLKVY